MLAIVGLSAGETNSTKKTTEKLEVLKKTDSREKRSYVPPNFRPKAKLERRIATGYYQEPRDYFQNEHQGHFSEPDPLFQQQTQHYSHGHHYPQYLEAPEPIIEIIIKESNESLPELPTQQVLTGGSQKKRKEQVQVFYVKYQKDPHKGVLIDKPIPALSPTAYHQEHEEEEDEVLEEPLIVTLPPPVKTTTLRTIIRPDSEKYHSNSGIHVTFNTEDKRQQGHQLQEENEESALQPVVALPTSAANFNNNNNNVNAPNYQYSKEFHSRFGQRFNPNHANEQFNPLHQGLVNGNQQLPFVNAPNQQFRSVQNYQNHNLHAQASNNRPPFHHPPPPNQQQSQLQNHRYPDQERNLVGPSQQTFVQQPPAFGAPPPFRQGPPNHHYHQRPPAASQPPPFNNNHPQPQPPVRFPSAPSGNNNQYHNRPGPPPQHQQPSQQPPQQNQPPPHRPIPIPLHQFEQQQLPHPQQQQHFSQPQNFQQQQPPQHNYQQFKANQQQQPPFNQNQGQFNQNQVPFGQQNRQKEALQLPVNNPQQFNYNPQTGAIQGGLVQQAAPNLSREQPQPHHRLQVQQQHQQQRYQEFNPNQNQEQLSIQQHQQNIENIVPGGELIQSVAKYEQHIIEQAPQYNFPGQQSQYNFASSSTPAPIPQSTPQSQRANIGPLANEIGHLNTGPTVAPLRPQPEVQQSYDQTSQHQQFLQQQFSHILQEPPANNLQPQIIPNSQPVHPGQSVSTHYSENLPNLEQQQHYYKQISNQQQDQLQQVVNINGRNNNNNYNNHNYETSSVYTPTTHASTTPKTVPTSKATSPTTTTQRTAPKPLNYNLPDEVPDDLRQQLLSSGILDNADISILDYDKLGETPLENLPPEHLANFFNAGGGAQISSSNQVLTVVKPNGQKIGLDYNNKEKVNNKKKSEDKTLPTKQNVDLKVVRFDSSNQKSVSEKYIKSDSTVLPSVDIGDQQYNRYLPLKINGAQFPIPDVEELRGKKITSVVVLAPVDNVQGEEVQDDGRYERDVVESKQVKFIAGEALKQLIKKPTKENFKKWLEREASTDIDYQSVVLLVAR